MLEAAFGIAVATEFAVVSRVPGSACVLIPTAIRVWLSVVSNWFSADGGRDGAQRRGGAVVCWDAGEAPAAACLLPAEVVQAGLLTVNWASLKEGGGGQSSERVGVSGTASRCFRIYGQG